MAVQAERCEHADRTMAEARENRELARITLTSASIVALCWLCRLASLFDFGIQRQNRTVGSQS